MSLWLIPALAVRLGANRKGPGRIHTRAGVVAAEIHHPPSGTTNVLRPKTRGPGGER